MNRHLSLVKSPSQNIKKIVIPKLPYTLMSFKCFQREREINFPVAEITAIGAQLKILNLDISAKLGDQLSGTLCLSGEKIQVSAVVRWISETRIGISFDENTSKSLVKILIPQELAKDLRPLHEVASDDILGQVPSSLKIWLYADGPVEVLLWTHPDGEYSSFQIIFLENVVEWIDGHGVFTGKTISKRNMETPLMDEDEFMVMVDEEIQGSRLSIAVQLLQTVEEKKIEKNIRDFMSLKLQLS